MSERAIEGAAEPTFDAAKEIRDAVDQSEHGLTLGEYQAILRKHFPQVATTKPMSDRALTINDPLADLLFRKGGLTQEQAIREAELAYRHFRPAPQEGEQVTCPDCNGSGESGLVPVCAKTTTDEPLTENEARKLADFFSGCLFCEGAGKVHPDRFEWRRIGAQWREARKALRVGMRKWAERVGASPGEYCRMENGHMRPDMRFAPVQEHEAGTGKGGCLLPSPLLTPAASTTASDQVPEPAPGSFDAPWPTFRQAVRYAYGPAGDSDESAPSPAPAQDRDRLDSSDMPGLYLVQFISTGWDTYVSWDGKEARDANDSIVDLKSLCNFRRLVPAGQGDKRLTTHLAAAKVHWKRCDDECTARGKRMAELEQENRSLTQQLAEAKGERPTVIVGGNGAEVPVGDFVIVWSADRWCESYVVNRFDARPRYVARGWVAIELPPVTAAAPPAPASPQR